MFEVAPSPHPSGPPRPASAAKPSRGTVLVVDDELTVVRVYARALGADGFRVLTATDGETAEMMFRRCRLDAVISDVSMPGMDGLKLLHAIHEIDPDVPVILATGDHADEVAHRAVEEGALMFLVKPVDLRALSQITAHAIQSRRAAELAGAPRGSVSGYHLRLDAPDAELDARFESALTRLYIAYQPIVCWATLEVFGYEALVRSDEPSLAGPGELFAAADRRCRTLELGRAIRALVAGRIDSAPAGALIFVNLHPKELSDEVLYSDREPLLPHARRVVLEITERDSLACVPDLPERIEKLRAAGFRIAVDDLGAGYAGLSSFAQLKPSVVKLDASLTHDVDKSPVKRKIVQAVRSLCQDMGVELIAEGVETEEERQTLGFLGCRYHQGFAYARPSRGFARSPADALEPGDATA